MKRPCILFSAYCLLPLSNGSSSFGSAAHHLAFASTRRPFSRIRSSNNMSTNQDSTTTSKDDISILPLQDASHNSAKLVITPDLDGINFKERLSKTIDCCRSLQKTSLWIDVPLSRASLMEEMQEFGIEFHHAQGDTATLNVWLDPTKTNKIPEFATHHVGVGALVVNSKQEILCVQELRNNLRPWKLPGGLSDLGEDIPQAACREVLEETGIECTFQSIVSFRHSHGLSHGRSDLYFVCRLQPVESVDENGHVVIPEPIPCQEEIAAAAWLPLQENRVMIHDKDNGHPMMQHVMKRYDQDSDIQQTVVPSIVPGRRPSPIYHPIIGTDTPDDKEE